MQQVTVEPHGLWMSSLATRNKAEHTEITFCAFCPLLTAAATSSAGQPPVLLVTVEPHGLWMLFLATRSLA